MLQKIIVIVNVYFRWTVKNLIWNSAFFNDNREEAHFKLVLESRVPGSFELFTLNILGSSCVNNCLLAPTTNYLT